MANALKRRSSPFEAPALEAGESAVVADVAGLAADSRTVAGWTLVGRITGFCRVVTIAAVLGPTYFGNLFQTSVFVPNVIHELIMGSLVTAMLVPALVRHIDVRDRASVGRLAGGFLGTALLGASCLVALCLVAAPLIVSLMTAAVDREDIRQQQQHLGWPLLAMILPQLFFYCTIAAAIAVQNAHGRFALAAAAPALENVAMIAIVVASAIAFGVGLDVDKVTMPQLFLLGLGSTAAVGLHAAAQWWGAYRVGVPLVPRAGWKDPEVRRVIRLAIPSSGYAVLNTGTFFGLLIVAGAAPGGAVAFQIGYNFFNLPVALGARALAAAQLPRLSRSFNRDALGAFHATYRGSLALTLFIALPASLLFVSLPGALAQAVSFGEMAAAEGTSLVAAAIGGLGVGIVGEAVFIVSTSASYARHDAVSPLRAMALRTAIVVCGMLLALVLMRGGTAILWTLCLSLSAANLMAATCLYRSQVRSLPPLPASRRKSFWMDVLVSAISVLPGIAIAGLLPHAAERHYYNIGIALTALAASGLTYVIIQWVRGSEELRSLLAGFLNFSPAPGSWHAPGSARLGSNEEPPR